MNVISFKTLWDIAEHLRRMTGLKGTCGLPHLHKNHLTNHLSNNQSIPPSPSKLHPLPRVHPKKNTKKRNGVFRCGFILRVPVFPVFPSQTLHETIADLVVKGDGATHQGRLSVDNRQEKLPRPGRCLFFGFSMFYIRYNSSYTWTL